MVLADKEMDEGAGLKLGVIFNPEYAQKLFEGSGHKFQEIAELGKNRNPLPTFPLNLSLKARARVVSKVVESASDLSATVRAVSGIGGLDSSCLKQFRGGTADVADFEFGVDQRQETF